MSTPSEKQLRRDWPRQLIEFPLQFDVRRTLTVA